MLTKNIIIVLSFILLVSCTDLKKESLNIDNNKEAVTIYKTATGSGIKSQEGGFGLTQ